MPIQPIRFSIGPAFTVVDSTTGDLLNLNANDLSVGAVSAWGSLTQGTAGSQPQCAASVFGSSKGVNFDGGDHLRLASSIGASGSIGSLLLAIKTPATFTKQSVFSVADEAAANKWFEVGVDSDSRLYIEYNNAGTIQTAKGSTFLAVSTAYIITVCFDGVDWYVEVDGVEENPITLDSVGTFGWFGSLSGTLNCCVGATVTSGGATRFFSGSVGAVQLFSADISE